MNVELPFGVIYPQARALQLHSGLILAMGDPSRLKTQMAGYSSHQPIVPSFSV